MHPPLPSMRVMSNNARGYFRNIRNLRDQKKRVAVNDLEIKRRAYIYIARNTSLPATVRHKAQLGLNSLCESYGRPSVVKNRCVETGRGRGQYWPFSFCSRC